jgi:chromosomal replication initiation ATPase DnaA
MDRYKAIKELESIIGELEPHKLLKVHEIFRKFKRKEIRERVVYAESVIQPSIDLQSEANHIAHQHGITLDELLGKKRNFQFTYAKTHFIRYVMMKYRNLTTKQLANFMKVDHSTIIHHMYHVKHMQPLPRMIKKRIYYE